MKKCKNTECNIEIENKRQYCSLRCRNIYVNKHLRDYTKNANSNSLEKKYTGNEKKCQKCKNIIPYEKRFNIFCSKSCSTSTTNLGRIDSIETRNKKSKSIIKFLTNNPDCYKSEIVFTKCKNCTNLIKKKLKIKFCNSECKKQYQRRNMSEFQKYKQDCLFKFSLNSYPNEFDFDLIRKYGWYKPVNRGNNLNGVSRDHLYSVMDGFKNNINPKLISHPANCKIILQKENSTKHKNSSITIKDLKKRIKNWNLKYLKK